MGHNPPNGPVFLDPCKIDFIKSILNRVFVDINIMTTTSNYQIYADFFPSKEEANERREAIQTNPRYKTFTQTHFTAGDEDQFDQYRFAQSSEPRTPIPSTTSNFTPSDGSIFEKFGNLHSESTDNTFKYIFNKFKKGIFIKIKDGRVRVFLPFSKMSYINEWHLNIDPTNFAKTATAVSQADGYKPNLRKISLNPETWVANNHLIRYESNQNETDTNTSVLKNMFEELCENRNIPDMEFFINRRDAPIMTKFGTEPYDQIWNGKDVKLVSHSYDKYAPILGMSTTDRFADIPIPHHNDWARVQSKNGKWFPKAAGTDPIGGDGEWSEKISKAVFRGASTGTGITPESNQRLKLLEIGESNPSYLDVGITKWNFRPRKLANIAKPQIGAGPINFPSDVAPYLTSAEQSNFKYVVHVDGHAAAFRLSAELGSGSCVLIVASEWKVWYSHLLIPYTHFVPVKSDMSDLVGQIEWCRNNDSKCGEIASASRLFYSEKLGRDGIFDCLQTTLTNIQEVGMAPDLENVLRPSQILDNIEIECLSVAPVSEPGSKEHVYGGMWKDLHAASKTIKGTILDPTNETSLFSNQLSDVSTGNINGVAYIRKSSSDARKAREHIHEAFIGINVCNELAKTIPNFSYIYDVYEGLTGRVHLIKEHVKGLTLLDYIKSDSFNMGELELMLKSIMLALQQAQQEFGFIHHDLTPWNIIVRELPNVQTVEYKVGPSEIRSISLKRIPVIIDYGRSKAIVNGIHHGLVRPFYTSTAHDVIFLITSCVKTLIQRDLRACDFSKMMRLLNLLHSPDGWMSAKLVTSKGVKQFIRTHCKFGDLSVSDKKSLELITPLSICAQLGGTLNANPKKWRPFMGGAERGVVKETPLTPITRDKHIYTSGLTEALTNKDLLPPRMVIAPSRQPNATGYLKELCIWEELKCRDGIIVRDHYDKLSLIVRNANFETFFKLTY